MDNPKGQDLPLVTAIVPCYNSEGFIDETLASLDAQTWPNLEILIADDASTDGTRAKLQAFAEGRSDTRLVLRDENLGWLANTNALMAEAKGEMMFFAFHDDLVLPTYVEALATALIEDTDAILSFTDVSLKEINATESKEVRFTLFEEPKSPLQRGLIMAKEPIGWWVPNRGLFRKTAYQAVGGIRRPKQGENRADLVWLLELALLGRFVRVPGALCQKNFQPTSLSKTWKESAERNASTRLTAISGVWHSPLSLYGKLVLTGAFMARLGPRYIGRKAVEAITGKNVAAPR